MKFPINLPAISILKCCHCFIMLSPFICSFYTGDCSSSPNLTWRDMQHLSVLTSKRNQLHDEVHQWRRNGVGLEFNHLFGYGVLDAGGMVKMAKEWKTVPERFHCVAGSIQETQWVTSLLMFSLFILHILHITSTQCTRYNIKCLLPRCWKENTAEHKTHAHLITGQSQ